MDESGRAAPDGQAAPAAEQHGMARASSQGVNRPRVLVADDDLEMLTAVASVVEGLGAEVVRASTGGTLIEHLADDEPYDLLITDLAMPWMNGLQVAHAVRSSGLRLPILLITARATPDVLRQIAALGGEAALLRKPFALEALEAKVVSMLPQRGNRADVLLPTGRDVTA